MKCIFLLYSCFCIIICYSYGQQICENPIKLGKQQKETTYSLRDDTPCIWILPSVHDDTVYVRINGTGTITFQRESQTGNHMLLDSYNTEDDNDQQFWIKGGDLLNITFKCLYGSPCDVRLHYTVRSSSDNCEQTVYLNDKFSVNLPHNEMVFQNGFLGCNFIFKKNSNVSARLDVFPFMHDESLSVEVYRGDNDKGRLVYSSQRDKATGRFQLHPSTRSNSLFLKHRQVLGSNEVIWNPYAFINAYVTNSAIDCDFKETFCSWKDVGQEKWKFDYGIGVYEKEGSKIPRNVVSFRRTGVEGSTGVLRSSDLKTGNQELCVLMEYGVRHRGLKTMSIILVTNTSNLTMWSSYGYTGNKGYVYGYFEIPKHISGYLVLTAVEGVSPFIDSILGEFITSGFLVDDAEMVEIKKISTSWGNCTEPHSVSVSCDFSISKTLCGWKPDPTGDVNFAWEDDHIGASFTKYDETTRIESPSIQPNLNGYCLEFEHGNVAPLAVLIKTKSNQLLRIADFPIMSAIVVKSQVSFNISEESRIVFEAVNKESWFSIWAANWKTIHRTELRYKLCDNTLSCNFSTGSTCSWIPTRDSVAIVLIDNLEMLHPIGEFTYGENEIRSSVVPNLNESFCISYDIESSKPLCLEVGTVETHPENRMVLWKHCSDPEQSGDAEKEEDHSTKCSIVPSSIKPIQLYIRGIGQREGLPVKDMVEGPSGKITLYSILSK